MLDTIFMELDKEIWQIKPFRNVYHRAAVNLIYTGKWIINYHSGIFKKYGLTLQQYNILRILNGQYPNAATVKLIQERMLDKMPDASRIVENLRKKGLIQRDLNSGDRRSVDVIITNKGIELLNTIAEKENHAMDEFLINLDPEETEQLNYLLDKIRN
ncbi:MAG: MarR family transcriptional regulator [Bacteroidota bacterium]|nr:MarR family transcriptional regulator [Bacteroidota bacterium]